MSGFLDNTQINYVFQKEGREGSARGGKNLQSISPPTPPSFWPCPAGWGFSALKFPPQPVPGVGSGRAEPCAVPSGTGGSWCTNNLWGLCGRGVFAHVVVSPCWDGDIVLKCQGCSALLAVVMPHGWDTRASCGILSVLQLSPGTSSHWTGLRDAQETFLHPSLAQAPPALLQDAAHSLEMLQDQLNPTGPSRLKEAQTITLHSLKQGWVLRPGTESFSFCSSNLYLSFLACP